MILAYIFASAFALMCAVNDYGEISVHKEIHHKRQWAIRAGAVVVFLVLWWISTDIQWECALFTGCAMAPLFSAVFRITLNTLCGKDWRYVSPSNAYDRLWLGMSVRESFWEGVANRSSHSGLYGRSSQYNERVHRAGLLATITEATALALLTACAYWIERL